MEAEDRVGAPEEEPTFRRPKRRRPNASASEFIDLSEAYSPRSSPRHPRSRLPNPLSEPSTAQLKPPPSPIYIDDEAGPSKPSSSHAGRSSNRLRRQPGEQLPPSRRDGSSRRWGELADNADGEDIALARKLQVEEEMRAAREQRALNWRMEALEREEAAAEAATTSLAGQPDSRGGRPVVRGHRRPPPHRAASASELDEHREGRFGRPSPTTGPRTARRRGWPRSGPMGFSDAMGEMFAGPSGARERGEVPRGYGSPFFSIFTELAALHQAVSGARNNALPPELLFSDRDFTEDDYEALLALDESVENRQGAAQDIINQLPSERVPRNNGEQATAYGEASVSKTQMCLQLLLTAQLPHSIGGLGGSAVYVYTEGEPALDRLRELATLLPYRLDPGAASLLPSTSDLMNNIFLESGFEDGAGLLARLHRLRPILERSGPRRVRLLVIDSIAWLFRDLLTGEKSSVAGSSAGGAPGIEALSSRTELLFQISALLRKYGDEFNLAVVVTNQIIDAFTDKNTNTNANGQIHTNNASGGVAAGHTAGLKLCSGSREVIPALGLAWANCINTRVFLSKETTGSQGATRILHVGPVGPALQRAIAAGAAPPPGVHSQLRHIQIVFSPVLPQSKCAYVVDQTGIRGLHPSEVQPAMENS